MSQYLAFESGLFDAMTALFDNYCNKYDLEFVAGVCLKTRRLKKKLGI